MDKRIATSTRPIRLFFGIGILMFMTVSSTEAQVFHWTGALDNQFYSVPGNWSLGSIPTGGDEIRFTGAATATSGLRVFDGLGVASMRALDGATVNFRPEGSFSSTTLEVGGSSTGNSGSFTSLNLLDFNGNTRLLVIGAEIGGFNSMLQSTGNFGNMQVNSGTTFESNLLSVGSSGNTGFLSVLANGAVSCEQLFVGRNVVDSSTSGSIMVQGAGAQLAVANHTIVGQTFAGGAESTGRLQTQGGSILLNTIDVGLGSNACGVVAAELDGMVVGSVFNLGTVGGAGEGLLCAKTGGSITADHIACQSANSSIEIENRGSISADSIEMTAGTLLVNGGEIHAEGDVLVRGNSQIEMVAGTLVARTLHVEGDSSIDWNGGEICLFGMSDIVIGDAGLFDRHTVVPSDGSLTTNASIEILSELRVDGVLDTPMLICSGDLILNDATVNGEAELSDISTVVTEGSVTFNDAVIGGGQFNGVDSTVRFMDLFAPETDLGGTTTVNFEGNVEFAAESFVALAIDNIATGAVDRIHIEGNLEISGQVLFGFPEEFDIDPRDEILLIETDGTLTGEFANLPDGAVFLTENGTELEIRYTGGDGNDIVLRPTAILGDVNRDGVVNLLDVQPFVSLIANGMFQSEADINQDGVVNLLDVDPFVELLVD